MPSHSPSSARTLVFVYNGDSGIFSAVGHALHKVLSPSTYPCSLCGLIYGPLSVRPEWTRGIAALGVPAQFLHRDELEPGPQPAALPAVFLDEGGARRLLIGKPEIDACTSVNELLKLVTRRVADSVPA